MTRLPVAVLTALATTSTPVLADVTAADVWQNANAFIQTLGGTYSSTPEVTGEITLHRNYTLNFDLPMRMGEVALAMPDLALQENDDGTVKMSFPNGYDIELAFEVYGEGQAVAAFTGDIGDFALLATGDPGAVRYQSGDSTLRLELASLIVDGQPFTDASFLIEVASTGAGTEMAILETDDLVAIAMETATEQTLINYDYAVVGLEDGSARTTVSDAVASVSMAFPKSGIDPMNLAPALRNGLNITLHNSARASASETTLTDTLGIIISEQRTTQGPSAFSFAMSENGLTLTGQAETTSIHAQEEFLPVPLSLNIGQAAMDWRLPLLAKPQAQDLVLRLDLQEVTVEPQLWDMIDPGAALDHSPMSFAVDFASQTILDIDLLDIEALAMLDQTGDLPGTMPSLTFDLAVTALGAALATDGAFDLDFGMMEFTGAPVPSGTVNFSAQGLNGAIEDLTAAGLVSPEETMPLSFGLGIIGRPVGNDAYEGTIELTEDGEIFANGMQLQ